MCASAAWTGCNKIDAASTRIKSHVLQVSLKDSENGEHEGRGSLVAGVAEVAGEKSGCSLNELGFRSNFHFLFHDGIVRDEKW